MIEVTIYNNQHYATKTDYGTNTCISPEVLVPQLIFGLGKFIGKDYKKLLSKMLGFKIDKTIYSNSAKITSLITLHKEFQLNIERKPKPEYFCLGIKDKYIWRDYAKHISNQKTMATKKIEVIK